MLTAFVLISLLSVVWGFTGIQHTGNYENVYGYMFWFGLPIFIVFLIIRIAVGFT